MDSEPKEARARTPEERRHEGSLATVIETISAGVVVADSRGVITMANPAARTILGESVVGKTHEVGVGCVFLHLDGSPFLPQELPVYRAIGGGETSRDVEVLVRREDATERFVLASGHPMLDENGRVAGAVAVFQDVTERRQSEGERARSANHLRLLLESTDEGIYGIDLEGRCTFVNRAAAKMLGYRPDELLGKQMHRLTHYRHPDGSPYPEERCPVHRAAGVGRGIRAQDEVLWRRDGTAFPVDYSAHPVVERGTIRGAVVTFLDITERKRVEAQREDLVRAVSHDLRTPLTIIQGHAQLLVQMAEATRQDGRQRHSAEAILGAARRMNAMIQDLVDSARLEAGQLRLQREPVELRHFLSDLLERAKVALDVGRVRVEIPEGLLPVNADPDRLERILSNLLSNALKYSPSDTEVKVAVKAAGGEVVVSVADRGVGIAPEDLPHMFERYYRAKAARKTQGLGLGLYITRMLVEAHGDRIWVDSEVGKGSTFSFTLPAGTPPAHHPPGG